MQLPIQYWKSTLTRLGVRVERRPAPQRSSASRFSVEMLERRQVMAADVIVDDSQIGFQITSLDWSLGSSGYLNESHIHTGGTGAAGAKWHVEGLTAGGQYQVFTTWAPDVGNATNTPLSVTNGTTTLGTVRVNQTIAPNDVESLGTAWKSLGVFKTSSGVLDIQITNDADGTVVADAVRLVEIRPTITGLTASPNSVALGSQVTLTATGVSDPGGNAIAEVRFYRDVNGDGVLTAADGSPVATDTSSSGGWSVSASTVSLPAGTNRFFAVAKDTTGVESDPVSVTATVLSPTRIIDDEDSGYSVLSGTWTESNTGYNNDHYYSYFNNGAVEWRFSNVVPGTYRVSATWLSASNRASAAPYEILDNTNSLATVLVNQKNAPAANVIAGGRNFQDLGNFEVVNGQLVVRLTNTTATTLCADAIRLEHIGPVQNVPEIRVYDGSAELYDAAATINFGSTFFGTAVQKTLTVKNVGVGNLSLTPLTQAAMPAGYTLVSGFGSTTLAQGQSTTFTVALSADSVAAASGTLSLVNNDSDEGSFDISLTGVVSAVTIKDDEDPGYAVLSGTWTESNTGYAGDHYFSYFNAGAVEWRFANLPSGTYRISATWTNASNRASAAPYEIIDGTNSLAVASVNQKNAPVADATAGGRNFQHLGAYEIVNGQLVVRLSNTAATTLSADAIRLEYLGPAQSVSEIRVYDGASELTDGTSIVGFGSTFFGTPIQKTLTVQNVGVASLTLNQLAQASMPAGYRLVSGLGATTLTQGQSTTFTVDLTAKAPGTAAGTVSILNNDPDEGSFDIQVTGFVQASRVIDDQDPGFSIVSGTWQKSNTGYGNDHFFVYSGDFGVVQWQFANLPVGQYRVSAAWAEHPNRTTIAPYTILDGTSTLATVEVNQKLPAAAARTEGGRPFQDLGVFGVVNGTLVVKLADTTSLAVSADAIRIEYVGGPEVRYTSSGPSLVIDGTPATALDFGPSERANKTVKYLAVTNATASDLTLTQLQQQDMPTGYVLESGFSALSLAPGATSFCRVRLDAITPGTYGGAIPIQSGAGSFQLNITGQVIKTPVLVDDGDPEFQTTGTGWQSVAYGSGFKDDLRRATGPGGTNTARWTVNGLAPGDYLVYATYLPSSANTAAAPYKLYDGTTLEQQFTANQRLASSDVTVSGMGFGYVGQINVSSGTLAVELNASAVSDGWAIADAVYVVPAAGGTFHSFSAPTQMVTGSANVLTAGFVDPDGNFADSLRVYRDSNNNGVLDLVTDQIWFSQSSTHDKLNFDMSTLPTGVHTLFVVAIKNGQEVARQTAFVTAAKLWKVKLAQAAPSHGEALFSTSGALAADATPFELVATASPTWWAPAVRARVTGTVFTYNTIQDKPNVVVHQYDFPRAFDVGTATTLAAAHGGFNAPPGSADQKLIVLEDLTDSSNPTNDGDYDDDYWTVIMEAVIPPPEEPGCGCSTCATEGVTSDPATGDSAVSTGAITSGSGAGITPSIALQLNQASFSSSGLGAQASTSEFGLGWKREGVARLVAQGNDSAHPDFVSVVFGGNSARVFQSLPGTGSPTFVRANGLGTTDTFVIEGGQYVYRTANGDTYRFNMLDSSVPALSRGGLVSQSDSSGNSVAYSFNADGSTALVTSSVAGQATPTERQEYVRLPAGDVNAGKVSRIDIKRGDGTLVRSVSMGYFDGTTSFGKLGQLATITTRDATGTIIDSKAYRYADGPSGNPLLQYLFDSESVRRVTAAGLDITTAANSLVAPYATNYLEYDSRNRVVRNDIQGAGCSACSGGIGTTTFSYAKNPNPSDDKSAWATKTTETRPDGTERIVYANGRQQPMLEVIRTHDGTTTKQFGTFTRYDSRGLAIWTATPEAVLLPANLSVIEQYPDLLHEVAGNFQYISDSSGLINVTTYFVGTSATGTTAGSADRSVSSRAVQRGDLGTPILQSAYTYYVQSVGGSTVTLTATSTQYPNTTADGAQTTTYAYSFAPGSTRVVSQTTSQPVVSTAENGPGTPDVTQQVFDPAGRTIWSMDGDGFLQYMAYDPQTGALIKTIVDVDTTQASSFANLPSGWTTPTGGGLHLVTTHEVDSLGRTIKSTDPNGNVTYTVYDDVNHSTRTYVGWNASTGTATGPIQVSRRDLAGTYSESLTYSNAPAVDSVGRPTGTEAITNLQSLTRSLVNAAGQVIAVDRYTNLAGFAYSTAVTLGVAGTNYLRTLYAYNNQGRVDRVQNPAGTITHSVYDGLSRVVSTWVGTDDSTTDGYKWSPASGSTSSNMTQVTANEYDNGGVGNGNLTKSTLLPGGGASPRVTQNFYDWRNRLVVTKAGASTSPSTEDASVNRPLSFTDYDNLGRVIGQGVYDGDGVLIVDANSDGVPDKPAAGLLRSLTTTAYDAQNRAFNTQAFGVDQGTGAVGASLTTSLFYDHRGNAVMTIAPNGQAAQSRYDGAGRLTASYTLGNIPSATWANATSLAASLILEQSEYGYDAAGNVILTVNRQRFHDASTTAFGGLGTPASGIPARVSYAASYFDAANRLTASVNVGTNGGVVYTRSAAVPARSDTALVTSYSYDTAGRVQDLTDPNGITARTLYDALSRTTASIANYTGGAAGTQTDVTTLFTFDSAGRLASRTAVQPTGTPSQVTGYVYGVSPATGSTITSNDIMAETRYPDPVTGLPSTAERDVYTTNALGERTSFTDRADTTHAYAYDVTGRQTTDAVTALGAGVDGAVRRIESGYGPLGHVTTVTSFNAVTGGTATNQVARAFNGFGQTTTEWQSHLGLVDPLTTPKVQYVYSEGVGGNHSRLTGTVYPDGYVVHVTYSSGIDDAVSRVTSLAGQRADSSTVAALEAFKHLGMGTVIERSRPEVNITFSLLGAPVDAGDQYAGLDRFGRVAANNWYEGASSTIVDGYGYTYDRGSNRLSRSNALNAAFSETYTNDALGQLESYVRGDSGSPTKTQDWQFDALGNWTTVTTDGVAQSRTANAQNELTDVGGSPLTYSATGNVTTDAQGHTLAYDAWNRLVAVYNVSNTLLARYEYDGLNHRVVERVGTLAAPNANAAPIRGLYYSLQWQVLEERVCDGSGAIPATADTRYIWSPVYVDAMIARDRNADGDGSTGTGGLEERVYAIQDGNWNTTAIIAATGVAGFTTGQVINRFAYTPYGESQTLDASWATLSSAPATPWNHLFQGLKLTDVTSLFYVRNRDYSAGQGRFVERDPIGFFASDNNWYRFAINMPTTKTDPLGLEYLSGEHYRTPTDAELGLILQTLKGGAAFGDQWPIAKSFLEYALRATTIADPQGSSWTHTDGDAAVAAIVRDASFTSAVDSALKETFVVAAAKRLSCTSSEIVLKIPSTPVGVEFKDGDLHYAINKVTFNITGTCKVTYCCKDETCVSVNYSCDLNVTGTDKYDFAWQGGSSSYLSFGRRVNNAAYAAQVAGKLGNYDNVFRFKHSQTGTMECPEKK